MHADELAVIRQDDDTMHGPSRVAREPVLPGGEVDSNFKAVIQFWMLAFAPLPTIMAMG